MGQSTVGQRPASSQDALSPKSIPELKLRDGRLSVTIFSRTTAAEEKQWFVVPERSYRNEQRQWQSTHVLHPDDLLAMALLLQRAYSEHRTKIDEPSKSA